MTADMGLVRGIITIVTMACFLAICWWAYRSGNRRRFEEDALIPFLDQSEPVGAPQAAKARVGRDHLESQR